jgi:hypothetical protein
LLLPVSGGRKIDQRQDFPRMIFYEEAGQTSAATRITLRPHDLEKLVPVGDIDPVYFDSPYYLYPDGRIAVETLRVIGAAMAEAGVVGIGQLTLSWRERMVMVEPRSTGMALFTLRAANEVRASQFSSAEGELDAEMVAIARAIIARRAGKFDPSTRLQTRLVRDRSFSHFVLNSSALQIFGHFGQLGGPDSELFDNFRLDRSLLKSRHLLASSKRWLSSYISTPELIGHVMPSSLKGFLRHFTVHLFVIGRDAHLN